MQQIDREILRVLQLNGKLSMQDLSEQVGASATQCWRRVKDMQDSGIIQGYGARLDPKSLGLNAIAYIHVALNDHSEDNIDNFLNLVNSLQEVVECASVTGDHDFILKVYTQSPEELENFVMRRLLKSGLVKATSSHFVLRQTKMRRALPII
ncbi:AsnC family transcriptional regulator [Amylibacter marinus]|uniref:AsnC family transcriptional regulator n=1 Tax=Amylibacter marinus TaxID=1475483 RepID=A0ABQ5VY31_9RHOB|nr:Lrp/AsnC family transcriptional regulator [Amylibacter marinus]GLQ36357.1 AsnC family transcriptional regulator [Amylibacter marinus]